MNEYEENTLSEQESLQLITTMINKAKNDFAETGISALMWGTVISVCALLQFADYYVDVPGIQYVWWLALLAVIPQIIISTRESRRVKYTSYHDEAMGGIWISFGIAVFLLWFYMSAVDVPYAQLHPEILFLIIYGIPTFATGYTRRFTPMIIGGIACWVLAILVPYTPYPFTMLYYVLAAQLAWFIPGLLLHSRYKKAKKGQHV